jgi:hypothetical protein
MHTRRVSVSKGTAGELAEHSVGYTNNATSEHTRRVAHGAAPKFESRPQKIKGRPHTLPELIVAQTAALAHLNGQLRTESDSNRRQRLQRNTTIKSRFLEKLRRSLKF